MGKGSIGEEIRKRFPRLSISLLVAFLFWVISLTIPKLVEGVAVPGIGISPYNNAGWLLWAMMTLLCLIFIVRASTDILVLMDAGTEMLVRRLGIGEEKSLKRVGKDIVYIILTILLAAAVLPLLASVPQVGGLLAIVVSLVALGVSAMLVYDIGRIIYRMLEEKARIVTEWLASFFERMAEREGA